MAAAATLGVVVWYAQYLIPYASSRGASGETGILPLVFLARVIVAGCVVWAVFGSDARIVLRVFLAAFGSSFLLLFGWYFMILGYDDAIFYVAVSADLLYLAGALVMGATLALAAIRSRLRNNHLEV